MAFVALARVRPRGSGAAELGHALLSVPRMRGACQCRPDVTMLIVIQAPALASIRGPDWFVMVLKTAWR